MRLIVTQKAYCDRPENQVGFDYAPTGKEAALIAFKIAAFDAFLGYKISWYITEENLRVTDAFGKWAFSMYFDTVTKVRVVPSQTQQDRYHVKSEKGTYLLSEATLDAVTKFAELFNMGNVIEAMKLRNEPSSYNKPE